MNSPFTGISELQKHKLFKILQTHEYSFNKNEEILSTLKGENIICILLEGHAQIVSISYNGEENLIEELYKDSIFGTNISNISDSEYQITALEKTKVLVIDYNKLIDTKNINYSYYNVFLTNLFDIINSKFRESNDRIKILTKKSIRDKLLAFFENEYIKTRSKYIYLPTNFKDLADYLSINRSAMFRELKYLKEEKFIKVDGNRITLLYTPNVH
ncbi:MAG: Crp/Fnr family transcriptional regulator [Clostridia bacterium]|nr:Crp/Fnr family transcriptional regulator [Clostridia bacterium]